MNENGMSIRATEAVAEDMVTFIALLYWRLLSLSKISKNERLCSLAQQGVTCRDCELSGNDQAQNRALAHLHSFQSSCLSLRSSHWLLHLYLVTAL